MKLDKLLPEVYYKESRDFAATARLVEIMCNYMKTAADCVGVNPDNEYIGADVVELLADTLGFKSKHKYDTKNLISIVINFTKLLKEKGSLKAVRDAVQILLAAQHIEEAGSVAPSTGDPYEIQIQIPGQLQDIILLEDLFEYILPAGITYKFEKIDTRLDPYYSKSSTTDLNSNDHPMFTIKSDNTIGIITAVGPTGVMTNDYFGTIGTGVVVSSTGGSTGPVAANNEEGE